MEISSLLAEMTRTASPAAPKSPRNETQLEHATAIVESNQDRSSKADSESSKDVDRTSSSDVPAQGINCTTRSDHNHESSIKLKRCKHGRIIIKDPLKRKSAQHSDNDANIPTSKFKNESNNNHIITSKHNHIDANGLEGGNIRTEVNERLAPSDYQKSKTLSLDNSGKPCSNQSQHQSKTPPIEPNEAGPVVESTKKISSTNGVVKRGETHLTIRARARSRSRSQSLSAQRETDRVRSPPRRSRDSRKKARRDRSDSRDRGRGSLHRSHSRKRSSKKSNRNVSKSSRRRRTPERPTSSRLLPKSRSPTPTRYRANQRHDHRDDNRGLSKERPKYDKYQHGTRHERPNDTYEKANHRRSPDDRRPRADTLDPVVTDGYLPVAQESQDNRPLLPRALIAQTGSKSSLAQVLGANQPTQQRIVGNILGQVSENAVPDACSKRSPTTRSPATPSIHDSSSSDTYDPEAPIIPVSPGDSPPISPVTDNTLSKPTYLPKKNDKAGEDDVPSSAVQLNQQEKYLQKLNRQERVIEEVKVALRPFYQNRSITKEQYKDVLRRAVPKICHSKNGEINPVKIRGLVDAYVKKMKR